MVSISNKNFSYRKYLLTDLVTYSSSSNFSGTYRSPHLSSDVLFGKNLQNFNNFHYFISTIINIGKIDMDPTYSCQCSVCHSQLLVIGDTFLFSSSCAVPIPSFKSLNILSYKSSISYIGINIVNARKKNIP